MNLLNRLEERVALPADSETQRSRKVMVVVVALAGAVTTIFNTIPLFAGDLTGMGWTYLASALYLLTGAAIIMLWPSSFTIVTFLLLLDVLIFHPLAQLLSGGFASGMYAIPWAIFAPLGAVLALGAPYALIHTVLFVLTVVLVALLEPWSLTIAPDISSAVRLWFNVPSLIVLGLTVTAASLYLLRQVERYRDQAESLLLNILPGSIATRLKAEPGTIADGYESVTVLFADIVDFTRLSAEADPVEVVGLLNEIFSEFDDLAVRHGLEKIKTIGDAYMVAGGLPDPRPDHVEAVVAFAQEMLAAVERHEGFRGEPIRLRVGINTGPVVAGVIGRQKFIYDLWGDAVNVASRMESNGLTNEIQVTAAVRDRLAERYRFEAREPIPIKGKGMMVTYLLAGEIGA